MAVPFAYRVILVFAPAVIGAYFVYDIWKSGYWAIAVGVLVAVADNWALQDRLF